MKIPRKKIEAVLTTISYIYGLESLLKDYEIEREIDGLYYVLNDLAKEENIIQGTPGSSINYQDGESTVGMVADMAEKKKPTEIKSFPGEAVDRHFKQFCHLPTTDLCNDEGDCVKADTKSGLCPKCGMWKGGDYGMNGNGEQTYHVCKQRCECGRPVASPHSEFVCSRYPFCKEDSKSEKAPEWETELTDKFCVMFSRAAREKGESDDDWAEMLENFIRSLLEKSRQEAHKEGYIAGIKENSFKIDGEFAQYLNSPKSAEILLKAKEVALEEQRKRIVEEIRRMQLICNTQGNDKGWNILERLKESPSLQPNKETL